MRELKFRVWDKSKNRYEPNCLLAIDETGDLWKIDSTDAIDLTSEKDRYVIEQFTGLTDMDGEEIYEGDIVRDGNSEKCFVKWNESEAHFGLYVGRGVELTDFIWIQGEDTKIIGNIHEGLELTKEN